MSSYQPQGLKKIFHDARRYLAKSWLSFFDPVQIAVTGSQGKTSTTQNLAKILSEFGPLIATDMNLDTIYNVPLTALKVRPSTKYIVWELGIDHKNEMDFHLQIARPTIAVITGISPVHTDKEHFGSLENLIKEKKKLIEALPKNGVAILNGDDQNVRAMAKYTKAKVLFYGTNKNYDVYADPKTMTISLDGTKFRLVSTRFNESQQISTGLIGSHNSYTLMACYLVVKTLFPKDKKAVDIFCKVISQVKPLKGRMSVEPGPLGTLILNDSLRANPQSTLAGLQTLAALDYQIGRKIAILGVMGELDCPERLHKETGRQLLQYKPDIVICLGDLRKYTYDEAIKAGYPKDKIFFAKDVFTAAEILKKIVKKNDLIYLKGSFLRNLKRILQILNNEKVCCRADICPYEHCGYEK